jgi:sugar transferase (PEP-CTERM system associated)
MLRILRQYYPARNAFFLVGESLLIYASVIISSGFLLGADWLTWQALLSRKAFFIAAVFQSCLYYFGLYDFSEIKPFDLWAKGFLKALAASSIIIACTYLIFPEAIYSKETFLVCVGVALVLISAWRFWYNLVLTRGWFSQDIMILGSGKLALAILNEILTKKDCGYNATMVVQLPEDQERLNCFSPHVACLDNFGGISRLAKERAAKKIVVAITEQRGSFPTTELLNCRLDGIEILEGQSFYEMLAGRLYVEQLNPGWLVFSEGFDRSLLQTVSKRMADILLSLVSLIVLMPFLLLTALLIKLDSAGPVFFTQERVGMRRKIFTIYKFRSMASDAEAKSGPVWAQTDDDRVTRIGRFIRPSRIDELPQLWNVLKGEMSIVGPRPEREFFVKQLTELIPYYIERYTVKPGITGWAQVNYPYGSSVEDAVTKLNYDLFYIKNASMIMDLMILMRTVKIVLSGKGGR